MKISNEIRVVGAVVGMLLVLVAYLLSQNTKQMRLNNDVVGEVVVLLEDRNLSELQQEYDQLVLECGEFDLIESENDRVRELCDERLLKVEQRLSKKDDE